MVERCPGDRPRGADPRSPRRERRGRDAERRHGGHAAAEVDRGPAPARARAQRPGPEAPRVAASVRGRCSSTTRAATRASAIWPPWRFRSSRSSTGRRARRRTSPSRHPEASPAWPSSTAHTRSAPATGSGPASRSTRRRWARCSWPSAPPSRRSAGSPGSDRARSRRWPTCCDELEEVRRARLRDDVGGARGRPVLDGRPGARRRGER